MAGPLDGMRVLDLSSVVLGPMATQIMGDLGADVIKIEGPAGDTTRYTGPSRSHDMAALFMGLNRNKRSIVLDLKQEAARDVLWRLIDGADVFIHSIRPQKLKPLGLDHESVLARNPRMAQMVRTYDKFDDSEKARISRSATAVLDQLSPSPHWS